jgi:hypothetical protein
MVLAFYKGNRGTFGSLIKWWTKSDYSHIELIIDGMWHTSSSIDGGVCERVISGESGNWDFVELSEQHDQELALSIFYEQNGKKYDWTGIVLTQIFPFSLHMKHRWFCSELVAEMLNIADSYKYSPEDLYVKFKKR